MRVLYRLIPLIIGLTFAVTAQAATVRVVETDVYIGGADGYKPVPPDPGTAQANVGDSVMAGEFGVGQVIYENGCVVTVRPGNVVVVEAVPPSCGEAGGAPEPGSEGLSGGGYYLLGAAIVAGVVVGAVALSGGGGSSKPASP